MGRLSAFADSEQLSLDDVLAEFRDASPSEGVVVATIGDVSQAKTGIGPHDGLCPFRAECYRSLGIEKQECGWNWDSPPTWHLCGGYRRRNGGMK